MTSRRPTVAGELIRIRHAVTRLRAQLDALEIDLRHAEEHVPPGTYVAQALVGTTHEVALGLAKIDAIIWMEAAER